MSEPPTRAEALFRKKLALLDRVRDGSPEPGEERRIPRSEDAGPGPVSYAQESLCVIDRMLPGSPLYNVPFLLRLEGDLSMPDLERGLRALVERHESLRTRFLSRADGWHQETFRTGPRAVTHVDLSMLAEEERREAFERRTAAIAREPFDLERGPPHRAVLFRLAPRRHALLVVLHHAVADAGSIEVYVRDLGELYNAHREGRSAELPELPMRPVDHARWQRRWLRSDEAAERRAEWLERLGDTPALDLPADGVREPGRGHSRGEVPVALSAGIAEALATIGGGQRATPFMTLLALFGVLLQRESSRDRVLVGSPVALRHRPELAPLIGFFVNLLPLLLDLSGAPGFRQAVARTRAAVLDGYSGQDYPFEKLVDELRPGRSPEAPPLVNATFSLDPDRPGGSAAFEQDGLVARLERLSTGTVKFDLSLSLRRRGDGWHGAFAFDRGLFRETTVIRWARHFQALAAAVAEHPGRPVTDIPLLSPSERHQLLREWNGARPGGDSESVVARFTARAAERPEALAILSGEGHLSFGNIERRSAALARRLRRAGAGREARVGVAFGPCADAVVALLGVLRAGAAFVPLDPSLPDERLRRIMDRAGAERIVAGEGDRERLEALGGRVDVVRPASRDEPAADGPLPLPDPGDLAYVLFTSGSTGEPKGVMVDHRSLASYLDAIGRQPFTRPGHPGPPMITPLSFDAVFKQLFSPLLAGEPIRLPEPAIVARPAALLDQLGERPGGTLNCVPSLWAAYLAEIEAGAAEAPPDLTLVLGGEALARGLVERTRSALPGARIWNVYGPTEATANATLGAVGEAGRIDIGRPLPGVRCHVVDPAGREVPIGAPGELWIGGEGVARGYLGQPRWTAERFVPDPWSGEPGRRAYRSGDLVRRLDDGRIEHLGRIDDQVQVRGFRVEPGEVESILGGCPGVRHAIVLPLPDVTGSARLAACVVSDGEAAPSDDELAAWAADRLPDFMVPSSWTRLDQLPRTATGKPDRLALAERLEHSATGAGDRERSEDPIEGVLCQIWEDLLERDEVGVDDDFFELGGQSLLAIRVLARVRATLGVDLPIQALFEAPTVAGLARAIGTARHEERADEPPPVPVPREGDAPLSFAQQRLWLLYELEPESAFYNVPFAVRMSGRLRAGSLAAAARGIVARHEVLRTTFHATDGEPVQRVSPGAELPLPTVDLRAVPAPARAGEVRRLTTEIARRPFDLERWPLLRLVLIRTADREHVLAVSMHHVVSDARSAEVFLGELAAFYRAHGTDGTPDLPELPIQYADHAVHQRRRLRGERLERHLSHWRRRLEDLPPLLDLPTDRPRPAVRSYFGRDERFTLDAALADRLRPLRRREGATLFMALLAAFHGFLHRLTGSGDLAVGTPISGRDRVETENLIGFFLNTLVVRARVDGRDSFRALVRRVRDEAIAAYGHRELPFERLVEALQPDRSLSHTPLFQTMFVLQDERNRDRIDLPELETRVFPFESGTSKFDLTLSVSERDDGFRGTVEYDTDLFDGTTIRRLVGHWRSFLDAASREPDRPLAGLPLMGDAERHQVTCEWNDTGAPPVPDPVHALFARGLDRAPEAVALAFRDEHLSYRELAARAGRLAHHLVDLGVGPEVPVGLCVERTAAMPLAVLAVAQAGGVCLPLDPAYPADRLELMVRESRAPVVLTETAVADTLPEHGAETVLLDGDRHLWAERPPRAPEVKVEPDHLFYVVYTSGSTGRPKGVALSHGALSNLLAWYLHVLPGPPRTLHLASLSFDVSFMETFAAWGEGGTLLVAPEEARRDPEVLDDVLERREVERATLPVVLLQQLARLRAGDGPPSRLRDLASTGEQLRVTPDVAELFARRPGLPLHNLYGPSESHVVTAHGLGPNPRRWPHHPPIGRPVARTWIEVLDRWLRPVPIGVAGELHIGGANLGRGYLGRPALTAERFVPDPLAVDPGSRLYRTGDLCRHRPDGALEYLGRTDHQVKLRGFRVEPGEIEAALADHPSVREAVVLAIDQGPEDRRLVAWYVPAAGAHPEPAGLRAHLRKRLPEYMVPSAFVPLDELPLNPNRKLDRDALPRPERSEAAERTPPETPVEEVVAAVWSEVLRVDEVGRDESFFELGGHSLLATRVISRLRTAFGVEVPLRRLFEEPTVAGLAVAVESLRDTGTAPAAVPIRPRADDTEAPLSFAQERILFFGELSGDPALFNLSMGFRLEGDVDPGALDRALCEIVRRHEVLRTAFSSSGDDRSQSFGPPPATLLQVRDLRHVAQDQRDEAARRWVEDEAWRPFDLGAAPQLRAGLLRLDEDEGILLVSTHHSVFDGWSTGLFLRELGTLYRAFAAGEPSPLDELPIQYADYAAWQRDRLRGEVRERLLAYWRERLDGVPPALVLPTDRPRPAVPAHRGGKQNVAVDPAAWEELLGLCRRRGVSPFMGLLAAFATLLGRTAGQRDLVVGTPIAGRDRTEIEPLLGCFINNLALRVRLDGEPSFHDLLDRVRETTVGAYEHQELPFEVMVDQLQPERETSRAPIFQSMLVVQNVPDPELDLPGVSAEPLGSSHIRAQLDLTLWMTDWRRGRGYLNYDADLFDGVTVERLGEHLRRLVAAATADPDAPVASLALLGAGERAQLLWEWNDSGAAVPGDGSCIHELFAARAETTPERTAVVHRGEETDYRELRRRSNRLARRLRALGVGPEDRVGIYTERSLEMLVGVLGTLTAGAAYLPLDPAHPRERITAMIEDAGASVVLVHQATAGHLGPVSAEALSLDGDDLVRTGPEDDEPIASGAAPDGLAYVIYTSGSTGRPKGVLIPHGSVVNFFAGMDRRIGGRPEDTWLALTGLSFDISVLELLYPLTRGLRVVLRSEDPIWSASEAERPTAARPLDFSLFYFASGDDGSGRDKYRLLLEGAKLADRHGFQAIWTPERHFHDFGGLYPNPSVVGAAIAAVTERVGIRSGSVVLPLHQPIRVAEEWAVVDNLSSGRVGLSFASGWHADDFVLAPDSYEDRKKVMREGIDTVRRLWRGESVTLEGGGGNEVEVRTLPRPIQEELPIWVTAASSPKTVRMAAELGAGLLTHLLAQTFDSLAETVDIYRRAWREHGHPGEGHVTLMIHTFVGEDLDSVRETVFEPFCGYLKSSLGLINNLMRSIGRDGRPDELDPEELDAVLAFGFERYFPNLSLMGTEETVLSTLEKIAGAGVDEVACLVDFGVEVEAALGGIERLAAVREAWRRRTEAREEAVARQITRHGVTHVQTTPSMAEMLLSDPPTCEALGALDTFLVGGEALSPALAERLREAVPGPVLNMYGPTETTIWSAVWPVGPVEDGVSIGRPIANTEIHLLDDGMRPVPVGVTGELLIGGHGLARGYGGRPGLTAERFVPDPFSGTDPGRAGARLYRTGDLARRAHDGQLEFLGRVDHQVKIRGHRVEPGEVETVLSDHPGLRRAAVVSREDGAGDRRLVAYFVPVLGDGALTPRLSPAELGDDRPIFTLPNGMPVVSLDDYLSAALYQEIFVRRRYQQHGLAFEDGACIFDVGANVGFFTLFAHTLCRDPRVFAFEPIPPTFEVLRANMELYGLDVHLSPCGLGERSETSEFTFYPHMPGLSGRHADDDFDREATRSIMGSWVEDRVSQEDREQLSDADLEELLEGQLESETFDCRVRSLSDVIAEHGIERVDLLKIDVERSEYEVLKGIRDEDWPKIRQVVLEVDTRSNLEAVSGLLEGHGFECAVEDLIAIEGEGDRADVYVAMLYARRPEDARGHDDDATAGGASPEPTRAEPAELRAWLSERLPDPMVPSAFVELPALPLNRNGKVDRSALPEPEEGPTAVTTEYVEPRQGLEQQIADVWCELLRVGRVGLQDNFFELGGSSLLVVRVRNRLRETIGRDLSLVDLFRHPTVESLAAHLTGDGEASGELSGAAVRDRVEKRRSARRRRRRRTGVES